MKLSLSAAAPVVKRREGRASRGASEAELDEFSIFWLMVEDESAELSAAVAGAPGGEVYL